MSLQIHNIKFPQVYLWTIWCANKRSPFLQKRIFVLFFFFQNHAWKLGVRLIHECGLYTSFYGNKWIQLCHISNLAGLMNNYSVWYIRASFKSNKLTTEKFSRSLSLPHFLFQVFFLKNWLLNLPFGIGHTLINLGRHFICIL